MLFASFAIVVAFLPCYEKRNCLLDGVSDLLWSVWIGDSDYFRRGTYCDRFEKIISEVLTAALNSSLGVCFRVRRVIGSSGKCR